MTIINVQLQEGGPITQMDTDLLEPNHQTIDNDNEHTEVQEWRLNGRIVHRSAHVTLKKGLGIESILGEMGNG